MDLYYEKGGNLRAYERERLIEKENKRGMASVYLRGVRRGSQLEIQWPSHMMQAFHTRQFSLL